MELADYYERRGELQLAFNECNALIYTVPFLDLFYEPAVKILAQMGNYKKALEILFESLKYQETPFAYQWIGQIFLINDETVKGITYLEKAIKAGSQDLLLLYNLSRAYYKISQFKNGDAILNQLKGKSWDQTLITNLESFKKSSYENFRIVSEYLKEAKDQMKFKKSDT
jgi:tetratricopeptide (TPR) repeat protein